MRTLLALASLTALIGAGVGCGDDTTTATADMTMGADLHAGGGDMAKMNCSQLLTCVTGCTTQACAWTCIAGASSTAVTKAGTLAGCVNGVCGTGDGGSGACTSPTDNMMTCTDCESAAVGPTAAGPCGAAYTACQADM